LKSFDKYATIEGMKVSCLSEASRPVAGPNEFPPAPRIAAPPNTSAADNPGEGEVGSGTQTLVRPDQRTATPKFYKVVIHNDDFTPRDFVVHVLQRFFRKDEATATELMLQIHHRGLGVAGVYTHEIAETKAYQVNEYSKQNRYPLRTTVERDD
jgi:ATP-dependent Clp protease adaptor protein ClpS